MLQWTSLTDLLVSRNEKYIYKIELVDYRVIDWCVISRDNLDKVGSGRCNSVAKAKEMVYNIHKQLKQKYKEENVLYRTKTNKLVKRNKK